MFDSEVDLRTCQAFQEADIGIVFHRARVSYETEFAGLPITNYLATCQAHSGLGGVCVWVVRLGLVGG